MDETKLAKLKQRLAAGDIRGALSIAAKFPRLGDEKTDITRAHAAIQNPTFYHELGQNPDELVAAGVAAMKRRWNID